MRIKLTLRPVYPKCRIPINYQYPVSAAIYRFISRDSKEYADWLHSKGYIDSDGKPHKLFVFSKLFIRTQPIIEEDILLIQGRSPVELYISSPMLEDFIQNFVVGLFEYHPIYIGGKKAAGWFRIDKVETLPPPEYKTTMKFKAISPIVVSTMREYKGKLRQYYFRPGDEGMGDTILHNLVRKYELIHQKSLNLPFLQFNLDNGHIFKRDGYKKLTKLITIKEDDPLRAIHVKAFVVPFTLTGNIELIQTAYECGIGEKNSLGFGMIEVA